MITGRDITATSIIKLENMRTHEHWPVWPDLAKFQKSDNFYGFIEVFGKMVGLLWYILLS